MFFIFPLFRRWNEEVSVDFCQTLMWLRKNAKLANSNYNNMPTMSKHGVKFMQRVVVQRQLVITGWVKESVVLIRICFLSHHKVFNVNRNVWTLKTITFGSQALLPMDCEIRDCLTWLRQPLCCYPVFRPWSHLPVLKFQTVILTCAWGGWSGRHSQSLLKICGEFAILSAKQREDKKHASYLVFYLKCSQENFRCWC